jgi:hypothetical protein
MQTMKSADELKRLFLQTRINYWKGLARQSPRTRQIIRELELIQVIVGKPVSDGNKESEAKQDV